MYCTSCTDELYVFLLMPRVHICANLLYDVGHVQDVGVHVLATLRAHRQHLRGDTARPRVQR
jgi:hypothetical protein